MASIAVKTLSDVEVNSWASNQHEFNGVTQLRELLGTGRQSFPANFYYLSNAGIECQETGSLTWYDARENNPHRTEYRLYYDASLPSRRARAGDTLLIVPTESGWINVYIIADGTQLANFLVSQLGRIGTESRIIADGRSTEDILSRLLEA